MIAKTRFVALLVFARAARLALLALVMFAFAQTAHAAPKQQTKQPAEPSPAAMKMAREILTLKNAGALFEPMVPGVIERIRSMHLQTNPNLKKALDEVAVELRKYFAPRTEALMNDIAWLYASRFSETELKEILTFYRTPTGKKVIELEPLVFDDAMAGLKTWQEKFAEEVIARFRLEMKKRGHEL
jgi:hypothetical protein